jgi:pyrroloquinoline quinone (PQQ) biosynthesis protein C
MLYEKRLEINQAMARSLGLKLHEIVKRSPLPGGRTSYTYLISKGEEERVLAGANSLTKVELYLDGLMTGMRLAKGEL